MTTKQQALKAIKTMPDEATLEEIMERLHFLGQVNAGIRDAEEGRTISHEEMKKRVRAWLSNSRMIADERKRYAAKKS